MAISPAKRQRERSRQERQREKELKREARKAERLSRPIVPGEDPDIAGIIPGPQPPLEDY
jgi:hypothetical protein